jgi:predicted lysophospholipase L1 biosynthesis ABC-type transport system permease subunit
VRSLLLLGVVALVLLIAIVNVANLMIGQTAARQRELALRASLGATPGRLARQLLTEAVVLAAAGGLLGTLLAFGQLALLKHLLPADTPRLAEVAIDARILLFAAAVSLGSGLLFGLWPAWKMRAQRTLTALEGSHANRRRTGDDRGGLRHHPAGWRVPIAAQLVGHAASGPRVPGRVRGHRRAESEPRRLGVA